MCAALALALTLAITPDPTQKLLDKKETLEKLKQKGYRGSFFDANQRDRLSFFDLGNRGADSGNSANQRSSFRGSMYGGAGLGRRLLGSGISKKNLFSGFGTVSEGTLRNYLKILIIYNTFLLAFALTGHTH